MKNIMILLLCLCSVQVFGQQKTLSGTSVMYNQVFNQVQPFPDLDASKANMKPTPEGLLFSKSTGLVRLNKYYSLAKRLVRYHVKFSADAKAVFQSDKGDFKATVDVPNKLLSIETDPLLTMECSNLQPEHEYIVEIARDYQESSIKLINVYTGEEVLLKGKNDGAGGVGRGAEGKGFHVGRQYDYYTFGLTEGTSLLVKQIIVQSGLVNPVLMIYGDSITEPEGYFPSKDFSQSWTQLIIQNLQGKAVSSGRGGTTIHEVLERIKNELPQVKAQYVMVTIGTNGGNTAENLSQLVEYIQSQGAIPILNNIPANESASHIPVNQVIEQVRQKYKIKGCLFDLATSVQQLGQEVDQSTMYFEDYDWGKIYHHPNVKGARLMYLRTLLDVPEIYQ